MIYSDLRKFWLDFAVGIHSTPVTKLKAVTYKVNKCYLKILTYIKQTT
jgi:hypothetical protein